MESLPKWVSEAVSEHLVQGESIQVIIAGTDGQFMIGTDRRIFVLKRGIRAGAMFGLKFSSWDYANISGVETNIGFATGAVGIVAPGANAKDVIGRKEPLESPSAIPMDRKQFERAKDGIAELRRLIADSQQSHGQSTAQAPDIPDQLRKLGELRDSGVITSGEFEKKKAELLARM